MEEEDLFEGCMIVDEGRFWKSRREIRRKEKSGKKESCRSLGEDQVYFAQHSGRTFGKRRVAFRVTPQVHFAS